MGEEVATAAMVAPADDVCYRAFLVVAACDSASFCLYGAFCNVLCVYPDDASLRDVRACLAQQLLIHSLHR